MNNFTTQAQQALAAARREAARMGHSYVGTQHLLLGLLDSSQSDIASMMKNLGLDRESVIRAMAQRKPPVENGEAPEFLPYIPRVKQVLARAAFEAKALRHGSVGSEHIFLGLLLEKGGVANVVLEEMNTQIESARAEVQRLWLPSDQRNESTTPSPLGNMVDAQLRVESVTVTKYQMLLFDTTGAHEPIARLISSTPFHAVNVGERFDDHGWVRVDGSMLGSPAEPIRYTVHSIKHVISETKDALLVTYCLNLTPWEGNSSPVWK